LVEPGQIFDERDTSDRGDYLSAARPGQLQRAPKLRKFGCASHEPGQPAPHRELEMRSERPNSHDLVDFDRLAHAFDLHRPSERKLK
jgi:hypothetical protein